MSWLRLFLFVAALGPVVSVVPHALAQSAGDPARAVTLGHEAIGLYNKGHWPEARAKFEAAERLAHSPVFVLYLARCARNQGDLALAKQAYERLVKEVVPKDAPAPWAAAVESGKQELPELERRIAEEKAAASASAAPTAAVSAPSPTSAVSVPVPVATAVPGLTTAASTAAPSSTAVGGPDRPGAGGGSSGSVVPGVVALGVGAVGVGLGIGLFGHASSIAAGIQERCGDRATCPEELANKTTAVAFADGATGAFVAGSAALAAGVVLLIVRPGGKPGEAKQAVSFQPGFASIRVSGSF